MMMMMMKVAYCNARASLVYCGCQRVGAGVATGAAYPRATGYGLKGALNLTPVVNCQ